MKVYYTHTPGPWAFTHATNSKRGRGKFITVIPVGDVCPVCDVNRHRGPDAIANAGLICAAPDLLSALDDVCSAINQLPASDARVIGLIPLVVRAEKAIARAKGAA